MSDAAKIQSGPAPPRDGTNNLSPSSPSLDFATGGAMGLLVGALIGLSTVPVVAGVISALTALVGAFSGLAAPTSALMPFSLQCWRIVGFGSISVLAIVAGIYLRTSQVLQPPIKDQVKALTEAGFDARTAQDLIAYRDFGIVPSGKTVQTNMVTRDGTPGLFATMASVCNQLGRARNNSVGDRLQALTAGGDEFANMAGHISRRDAASQKQLLDSAEIILCGN